MSITRYRTDDLPLAAALLARGVPYSRAYPREGRSGIVEFEFFVDDDHRDLVARLEAASDRRAARYDFDLPNLGAYEQAHRRLSNDIKAILQGDDSHARQRPGPDPPDRGVPAGNRGHAYAASAPAR